MNVKKAVVVLALIGGLGFTGLYQAQARGWGGGYGGNCQYVGCGQNYQMLDEATKAKADAFRKDTSELRRQMAMKRAEKQALLSAQNPSPADVAKVEGELFDLRTEMQSKAIEAGLPAMGAGPRGMRGGGKGGPGMRPCYQQTNWNAQ